MNSTKATTVVVISIALSIYVLYAIWSGVQPSHEGYNTKTAGVVITEPESNQATDMMDMSEVDDESAMMEEPATSMPETEQTTDSEPVIPAEVEAVVEESVVATETATEQVEAMPAMEEVTETVEAAVPATEAATSDTADAGSQVHIVTAEGLKYNPLVVKIAVGDTVAWENMSTHDTQSLEGLIPEGAEMWHSGMGENYQRTFTVEGIYVYKCTPHFGAGMGGVIIVGNPVNIEAIKAADVAGAAKRLVKKALQAAAS